MNQYAHSGPSDNTSFDEAINKKPHSGIGISSFILSLVSSVGLVATTTIAGVMENSTPGGVDEESAEAILLGLVMIGLALMLPVSAVLGLVSLFQSSRKKLFGILGLCFSLGMFILFVGLMIVGTMMG